MANYNAYLIDDNGDSVFYQDKPDLSKGNLYISVSQVLSMLGGNDFLIRWALTQFGGQLDPIASHKQFMDSVSSLGTALHKYIEYDLKNEKFTDVVTEAMMPGIESWHAFKNEHKIELIDSERVLHSKKLRMAGTLDQRMKIDGVTYICDLKTGSVQSKAFIQLTAYKTMMKEMGLSDGSEELLVLGGADSKSKIATGGKIFMHSRDSWFKGRVSEEDLYIQLMCLRELWYQENIKSRKFEPIIKGMQEYIDPIIERFKDSFKETKKSLKKGKK